ncbi:MAG: MarR family transcriptional regulator [Clostridia bacterium]|nr:MarR family transcriptional regulator [Clostridia bacterium]
MVERFEVFTILLNRLNRNIRKIKNKEMANYELRSSHISCLYYLYISEGLTSKDLCERCEEDKATISRSLDYLEKNGYLICKCQNKKRYNSPFELTERGIRAGKRIADKISSVLDEISIGISEEDREIFYRSLSIISENIDKVAKSYDSEE